MTFHPVVATAVTGTQPYQFRPETYGAKGNTVLFSDAAITTGHAVLTSPGNNLAGALAGQSVYIPGAGAAGADLFTSILSVQNSGQVTLAANAGTSVSANGCAFGTDDTSAIQQAVNAAVAYAQTAAGNAHAAVVFGDKIYMVSSAPTIGGSTAGNAIITLPIIAMTAAKVTLEFTGAGDVADTMHWLQTVPQASGTTLLCPRLDGTNDGTNGPASVIGGPYNDYGANSGSGAGVTWNNLTPVIDGIRVLVPQNSTYGGFDFYGQGSAYVANWACFTMQVVPSAQPWPTFNEGNISNQYTFGLRMPSTNDNDRNDVGYGAVYGMCYGIMPTEHTVVTSHRSIHCLIGITPYNGSNGLAPGAHGIRMNYMSVEACTTALSAQNSPGGASYIDIGLLDMEVITSMIFDSNDVLQGVVNFRWSQGSPHSPKYLDPSADLSITGGTQLKLVQVHYPQGPVGSPPAIPATTVAAVNGFYRDATIYLTSGGAAVTVIKVNGTTTGLTLGTAGTVTVRVPAGQAISMTYASTAPTWVWVLD